MLMIFDVVMILLLITALVYGAKMNIRLKEFEKAHKEFTPMIAQLQKVSNNIVSSSNNIKSSVQDVSSYLGPELPKIQLLYDDLKLLVEYAEKTANRLERDVDQIRHKNSAKDIELGAPTSKNNSDMYGEQDLWMKLKNLC